MSAPESGGPPAGEHPIPTFLEWLADAEDHDAIRYANAATLATVEGDGVDARVVLVHRVDARGFLFGSDTRSPKARQLRRHPAAALTFYWGPLDRQVRIRGDVVLATATDANHTFDDRPRESRITAWVCQQSREVAGRPVLERRFAEALERFDEDQTVPRPDTWRAYRLAPTRLEFWQARPYRLHERHVFEREPNGDWRSTVLEP